MAAYKDLKWTYSYHTDDGCVESGLAFDSADEASAAAVKYDEDNPGEQNVSVHPIMPAA